MYVKIIEPGHVVAYRTAPPPALADIRDELEHHGMPLELTDTVAALADLHGVPVDVAVSALRPAIRAEHGGTACA